MKQHLDISNETCPITFVKSRLFVDKHPPGKVITIRVSKGEALGNVSQGLRRLGHIVSEPMSTKFAGIYEIEVTIVANKTYFNRNNG